MADTLSIGRITQIGPESIPGTAVAATKQLTDLTLTTDPAFNVGEVRGTGHRFNAAVYPDGMEHVTGKLGGALGYNSVIYPASMLWGGATPTIPTGGVNARQWKWTPALTGSVPAKTFTMEQGDSADSEQVPFTLLTDFGIDFTRAQVQPSGNTLGQALNKAGTGTFTGMSGGTTVVPIVPVLPVQWAVYMDATNAAVGNTQLLRCFHAGFTWGSVFGPFYPLNPSIYSYAGVADNPAMQQTALLELMKDAVGEGLWQQARAGQTRYIRLKATSVVTNNGVTSGYYADNYNTLTFGGTVSGGTWTFTYKGQTATGIAWNATNGTVLTAIQSLSTVGAGNVTVSGGPGPTAYVVTMTGALANDNTLPTVSGAGLTGTSPTLTLTQTLIPYSIQIDFAGQIKQPGPQADNSNLRTRQWDFIIIEDPTWSSGQGFVVTVVNALTGY